MNVDIRLATKHFGKARIAGHGNDARTREIPRSNTRINRKAQEHPSTAAGARTGSKPMQVGHTGSPRQIGERTGDGDITRDVVEKSRGGPGSERARADLGCIKNHVKLENISGRVGRYTQSKCGDTEKSHLMHYHIEPPEEI